MCERLKGSGEVSPQMIEEFRRLFEDWLQDEQNQECLEGGGTGNLEQLARRVMHWAVESQNAGPS